LHNAFVNLISFTGGVKMSSLQLGIVLFAGIISVHACQAADATCHYPEEAHAMVTDWTGKLAAGYRAKLSDSPDDPATLFLVGVSLLPEDPTAAVQDFDHAIAKDPRYPWPYFELMDVYAILQPNSAKLAANMRAYRDICPANGDAFRYLSRISDRAETGIFAQQLRTLLEHTTAKPELARYADLWAAEFRAAPPTDFDALRDRIRGDLKRLEALGQADHGLLETLETGYKLTGQTESARRAGLDAQNASDPALAAYRAWNKDHPFSTVGRSPEALRAYREAHRKEAEELAAKWPDSRASWMEMLQTASTAEQATQAGDKVIQLAADDPDPDRRAGAYGKTAQVWLHYGIRLKDVPGLANQALRDLDRAESADGPILVKSAREVQMEGFLALECFDIWDTLVDATLRLGEVDEAGRVAKSMQAWLAAHPIQPDTPANVVTFYPAWEASINAAHGKIAETQGRKADALAYYQRVVTGWGKGHPGNPLLARAQALWKELGGTDDGWLAWSKPMESRPVERKPAARVAAPSSTPAGDAPSWTKVNHSFADLNLSDLTGRVWTAADFRGKVTLIDVWASWCGPCTAELPHIQELYDKIRTRTDVQLVTLDVDENPGMADLLVRKQHYTFPVLMAEGYFAQIQPALSVPRTWIVDKSGIAHLEKINSNEPNGSPTFVQDVLEQLNK
jgi:thiol-disulfide isomerase/thioredoxin/tetratricopeptide (TPR) repeat protein